MGMMHGRMIRPRQHRLRCPLLSRLLRERLGVLPTEKVPLWAAYWIAGGRDGEALIYLAGLPGDDPREVYDALPQD